MTYVASEGDKVILTQVPNGWQGTLAVGQIGIALRGIDKELRSCSFVNEGEDIHIWLAPQLYRKANKIEPNFSTQWEREDYERNLRGEKSLGPEVPLKEIAPELLEKIRQRFGSSDHPLPQPLRLFLPTLSDLIDRLTITQQKMIFITDQREHYVEERRLILHDIDLLLKECPPLNARALMAITMIQLTNRCIWESESKARAGGNEQNHLLKFTHSINGVRNTAKNILAEEAGGRKDYKIDALAADLPEELGNWAVFEGTGRD